MLRAYDTHDANKHHNHCNTHHSHNPNHLQTPMTHNPHTPHNHRRQPRLTRRSRRPRPVGAVARHLERVEELRGKPQGRRRRGELSNGEPLPAAEAGDLCAHTLIVDPHKGGATDEVAGHGAEERQPKDTAVALNEGEARTKLRASAADRAPQRRWCWPWTSGEASP